MIFQVLEGVVHDVYLCAMVLRSGVPRFSTLFVQTVCDSMLTTNIGFGSFSIHFQMPFVLKQ
jgi:hypothetical protein